MSTQAHTPGTWTNKEHSKDWLWYGSYKQLDEQGVPGVEPILKACSIGCMEKRSEAQANRRRREELARLKAEEEEQAQRLEWLKQKRERAERELPISSGERTE